MERVGPLSLAVRGGGYDAKGKKYKWINGEPRSWEHSWSYEDAGRFGKTAAVKAMRGSEPINRGQTARGRHLVGGKHEHLAFHFEHQFGQVVERVVAARIEIAFKLNGARSRIDLAGNLAIGFHEQRVNSARGRGLDCRGQIVRSQTLGIELAESIAPLAYSLAVPRFDHAPALVFQALTREKAGVQLDPFPNEKWVLREIAKQVLLLGQRREDKRQTRGARMLLQNGLVDKPKEPMCIVGGRVAARAMPPVRLRLGPAMRGKDGERKLASGAGRKKQKSGGEAKKETGITRTTSRRTGSSKQRKG